MLDTIKNIENFLSVGDLVSAKKELDILVEKEENPDLYIHYLIALYHIKKEEYILSVPHLVQICESQQEPYFLPKSYKLLAYAYLKQAKYWDARAILETLMEDFYSDTDIKNMFAFTLFGLKQIDEATILYQEIISEDEKNLTARNGLASILSEIEENPTQALEVLEPYANKDPRILDTLGWAYFQLGNLDKAKQYLQQAFDITPHHPEINKHLTIVMSQL